MAWGYFTYLLQEFDELKSYRRSKKKLLRTGLQSEASARKDKERKLTLFYYR